MMHVFVFITRIYSADCAGSVCVYTEEPNDPYSRLLGDMYVVGTFKYVPPNVCGWTAQVPCWYVHPFYQDGSDCAHNCCVIACMLCMAGWGCQTAGVFIGSQQMSRVGLPRRVYVFACM